MATRRIAGVYVNLDVVVLCPVANYRPSQGRCCAVRIMPSYEDLGEFVALAAALLVLPKLGVVVGAGRAFPDGLA